MDNLGLTKVNICKKYINSKLLYKIDLILHEEHIKCKTYRNCNDYENEYFETWWNDIKNTWKNNKKSAATNLPIVPSLENSDNITYSYDIVNTLNNYFAFIAKTNVNEGV